MLAADTNVIVRLLTNDDPDQVSRAVALFQREQVFIVKTVLLETEWVLRYCYQLSREAIVLSLRKLVGLANVMIESPDDVGAALDWYEAGMDFGDALHLASSGRAERFATFDQKLAKLAGRLQSMEILVL